MWSPSPNFFVRSYYFSLVIAAFSIHFAPALCSIAIITLILSSWGFIWGESYERKVLFLQVSMIFLWGFQVATDLNSGTTLADAIAFTQVSLPLYFLPVLMYLPVKSGLPSPWIILGIGMPLWWYSGAAMLNYSQHFQFLSQMVLESKPLPSFSQVYHIEFSMLLTSALLVLLVSMIQDPFPEFKGWYSLLFALLLVSLHVVSTRTGLLGFWLSTLAILIGNTTHILRKITLKWRWVTGSALVVFLFLMVQVPSFKNRLYNTREDLQTLTNKGDINHKSFSQRVEAWKATWYMIQKESSFIKGVGSTAYEDRLQDAYLKIQTPLFESNRIGTHNQWLQWIATYGYGFPLILTVILALLFKTLFSFGMPLWMFIPIGTASLFESIAQRQSGVLAGILLWTLIGSLYLNLKKTQKDLNNSLGI
jgi:hypothetical protein